MAFFPFLGGSFNGRSPSFDAQRAVNCFIQPSESKASRSPAMLLGTPGLRLWQTFAGGRVRGFLVFTPELAVVIAGGNVWTITPALVAKLIGTIDDTTPTVSMASNGSVVMLVDGSRGYFINPTLGTVNEIGDTDFIGGDRVDFIDGYFIWNTPGTGQFQITQLYGEDIDGLDFATAEGSPDKLVTIIVDHREAWMLGTNSAQIFINTGNADFPLESIQGAFLEIGCAAAQSVAKADNSIFWLATDDRGLGTVQRAVGYAPQRVSNHAVEFAIARYAAADAISDAVAYTYAQEGHTFYVLAFPSANAGLGATWVLDISTGLWHERAWRNPITALLSRHRSNCQMNFGGLILVGDWENGNVYVLDLDTFTDNGDPLPLIRVAPHISNDAKRVIYAALELTMQTGVGLADGQGSDPQARLRWSDDGGYSWSNERSQSIGKIGERKARVRFTRLGMARDRVFSVEVSDPVRRVFTGCALTTLPCGS